METEVLDVNGVLIPHVIVPIRGDGACLFRAICYVLYGNQNSAQEIREQIVQHVVNNWDEFAIQSYDNSGNNYSSVTDYFAEMSLHDTYGSACELAAAAEIYMCVFEVYREGILYTKFGIDGYPIKRLRFKDNLSCGHFDAYIPMSTYLDQEDGILLY